MHLGPKLSPHGSFFYFAAQHARSRQFSERNVLPPQWPNLPHPTYPLYNLRLNLCSPGQNRAGEAQFHILQAKTRPPLDLANPMRQHANYGIYPTTQTQSTVRTWIYTPRVKIKSVHLFFGFAGQNHPPCVISPSQAPTTSTISCTQLNIL